MDYGAVQDYLYSLVKERDLLLLEMEDRAKRTQFPIVGPVAGTLLYILTKAIGAKRVFELGSGYGYSGIWFARALPPNGEIFLTDYRKELLEDARDYFKRAGLLEKARFLEGDAFSYFANAEGQFDIVYCDIEKERYPDIIEIAHQKLRVGGFLIADNLLWHGKVMEGAKDSSTRGISRFTRLLHAHPGFETVIIPIRDGLSVSLKCSERS